MAVKSFIVLALRQRIGKTLNSQSQSRGFESCDWHNTGRELKRRERSAKKNRRKKKSAEKNGVNERTVSLNCCLGRCYKLFLRQLLIPQRSKLECLSISSTLAY
jgi:hypothetical protein